jgi:hypothetical protein
MPSINGRGHIIPTLIAIIFAALGSIGGAIAALPIDACARPSTYPYGPSVAATDAVMYIAYDKGGRSMSSSGGSPVRGLERTACSGLDTRAVLTAPILRCCRMA